MSNLKITGQFKAATKTKQITDKFSVQKFYIDFDVDKEYPGIAEFQINNNKIDISQLTKGDEITVHFNISGRKWKKEDRSGWVQNLTAWKIDMPTTDTVDMDLPADDEPGYDLPF